MCIATQIEAKEWKSIINKDQLVEWSTLTQHNDITIKNGILLLNPKKKTWLLSDHQYKNFILECEVLMPNTKTNAGIGFRMSDKNKVIGYKCEIYSHEKLKSGSIYGVGKGWIYPEANDKITNLQFTRKIKDTLLTNEWNHYKVHCENDTIKVYINQTLVTSINDTTYSNGFLGIVHKYGDLVKIKNIKVKEL